MANYIEYKLNPPLYNEEWLPGDIDYLQVISDFIERTDNSTNVSSVYIRDKVW